MTVIEWLSKQTDLAGVKVDHGYMCGSVCLVGNVCSCTHNFQIINIESCWICVYTIPLNVLCFSG